MDIPDNKLSPVELMEKHSKNEDLSSGYYLNQNSKSRIFCWIHYDLKLYVLLNPGGDGDFDVEFVKGRLETLLDTHKDQLKHDTDIAITLGAIFDEIDLELLVKKTNSTCDVVITIINGKRVSVVNLGACISFISEDSTTAVCLAMVHDVNNDVEMNKMRGAGLDTDKFEVYIKNRGLNSTRVLGGYDFKTQFIDGKKRSLILSEPEMVQPSYTNNKTSTPRYLVHCSAGCRQKVSAICSSPTDQKVVAYLNRNLRIYDHIDNMNILLRMKLVAERVDYEYQQLAIPDRQPLDVALFAHQLSTATGSGSSENSGEKARPDWYSSSLIPIAIEKLFTDIEESTFESNEELITLGVEQYNSELLVLKNGESSINKQIIDECPSLQIHRSKDIIEITSKLDFSDYREIIKNAPLEKIKCLRKILHRE